MDLPTISITPCAPTSLPPLNPPDSRLPFRSLRVNTSTRPLLREQPPPAAPLIFPASMWRASLPTEHSVPMRATFPFHCHPSDLTIDTVLANAHPQHLHVSAPDLPRIARCPSAWQPRSPTELEQQGLLGACALLARRRLRRRRGDEEGRVRHAQPIPYSAEERAFRKLLRHKQAVEEAFAAFELGLRRAGRTLEDVQGSEWYQGATAPGLVDEDGNGDGDGDGEQGWLLVSDGDDDDAQVVETGEEDILVGFEKLVDMVAEDFDGEMSLERRESFDILGSLL